MRIQNFSPSTWPAPVNSVVYGVGLLAISAMAIWILKQLAVSFSGTVFKKFSFCCSISDEYTTSEKETPRDIDQSKGTADIHKDFRIIDVQGDGNCYFHALKLTLEEINHPHKHCSPEELRCAMSSYLRDLLHERLDLVDALRRELSEIADAKAEDADLEVMTVEYQFREVGEELEAAAFKEPSPEQAAKRVARAFPNWEKFDTLLPKLRGTRNFFSGLSGVLGSGEVGVEGDKPDEELQRTLDILILEMSSYVGKSGVFVGEIGARVMAELLGLQITIHVPGYGGSTEHPVLCTFGDPEDREIHLLNSGKHFKAMFY